MAALLIVQRAVRTVTSRLHYNATFVNKVLYSKQAGIAESDKEVIMLRLTVSTEEYLMIGEDVKLVFLGGTGKHLRIMVDAPRDKNIIRSTVLERNITNPEERAKLPRYYAEEEHPEKYVKKADSGKSVKKEAVKDTLPKEGTPSEKRTAPENKEVKALKNPRIIITQGNVRSGSR